MNSIRMKAWGILFFGAISGCAPQAAETDERPTSQSFPLQVEDIVGTTSFRPTRPSFGVLEHRTAVRLQDGQVLLAGGSHRLNGNLVASPDAELFDPEKETWKKLPPMHYERVGALGFALKDGRGLIISTRILGTLDDLVTLGIPEIFDPVTKTWTACEQFTSTLWDSPIAATLLVDGRVLITSGSIDPVAYFFDTNSLTWSPAPLMKYSRDGHTSILLADGRVLVAGGTGYDPGTGEFPKRLIAEIFDPKTNKWSDAAAMNAPHEYYHVARLLPDETVMLLDGSNSQVEIFDPHTEPSGVWIPGPSLAPAENYRGEIAVATMLNGDVLVVGGQVLKKFETESLIYSFSAYRWSFAGKRHSSSDSFAATTLKDGRVLIVGGPTIYDEGIQMPLKPAELYARDTSAWKPLPAPAENSESHTATRLLDGRVLLAGWSGTRQVSFIFSPNDNDKPFTQTAPMLSLRTNAAATLLQDGRVMVIGGMDQLEHLDSTEIFDPLTESWSEGPSMNATHEMPVAERLADGRVLVAGQSPSDPLGLTPEVFDPQTDTWTPLEAFPRTGVFITGIAPLPDGRAVLSGFRLNGNNIVLTIDINNQSYEPVSLPEPDVNPMSSLLTLSDGQVLVASYTTNSTVGLFDPSAQKWRFLGKANIMPPLAMLPSGDVLWADHNDKLWQAGILDVPGERMTLIDSPDGPFSAEDGYRLTPLLDGRILVTGHKHILPGPLEPSIAPIKAYVYGKSKGDPCAGAFECVSGYCVDGYCCDKACDDVGPCNACAFYRGATANGTCTAVEACAPHDDTCTMVKTCAPFQCDRIDIRSDGQDAFCTEHCSRAADCAPTFVCNFDGHCVSPKNVDVNAGCTLAPHESPSRAAVAMAGLLLALSRLRRSAAGRRSRKT
jgi:hypothetical protein